MLPRYEVYQRIVRQGMVPVYFHSDPATALSITESCIRAGAEVLEFTNRGQGALEVFRKLAASHPRVLFGAGSIIDAPSAALFLEAGAQFIVSPCLDREVMTLCHQRKIAYIPGCATTTEIHIAEGLGAEICKIFPGGQVGGPDFIKAILAPRPWSSLMPTGGVSPTRESLSDWFRAGIVCAGMGSKLLSKELVEKKDWEGLRENVHSALVLVREIRETLKK